VTPTNISVRNISLLRPNFSPISITRSQSIHFGNFVTIGGAGVAVGDDDDGGDEFDLFFFFFLLSYSKLLNKPEFRNTIYSLFLSLLLG